MEMSDYEALENQKKNVVVRLSDGLVFGWTKFRAKDTRNFRVVSKAALEKVEAASTIDKKNDPEIQTISFNYDGSPKVENTPVVDAPPVKEEEAIIEKTIANDVDTLLSSFKNKGEVSAYAEQQFGIKFPALTSRAEMEEKLRAYFSGTANPIEG